MGKMQIAGFETKTSYKILKVILYALLLTPLPVWSGFLFPFITSKVMYFRPLVELALIFYIPLAFKYPELRPRWNWLSSMVWVYLGVMIATSIVGLNFYKSFWGTVERGEGILTMLHFAAYFTMLSSVLKSRKDWTRYITAAIAMITFTGFISLGQLMCGSNNIEGICQFIPPSQGERISATIGNAAFYAAFLLFGVMLSWLLGSQAESKAAKYVFYANAVFNAVLMVYTLTRGGFIALYAAVFIVSLFQVCWGQKKRVRIATASLAIIMVVIPLTLFLKPEAFPQRVRDIGVVRRLLRISITDTTTQSRIDTWRASFTGWQDRFWTGYGYENFNLAFNKYFPPRIFKTNNSQIWFDRAHNIFFDVSVTSGIVGLAAYLGIFVAGFLLLYRLFRVPGFEKQSAVILFALLVGYFIQNFFVFDTQATYLLFFLVLGFIASQYEFHSMPPQAVGKAYNLGPIAPAILVILMAVGTYFFNLKAALANHYAITGFKQVKLREYRELLPYFQKALSYGTYMDEEIRQHLVSYANEAGSSGKLTAEEKRELYLFVAAELDKNLARSPLDVKNHLYLMNFLNISAAETNRLEDVFELGHEALKLSPTRMQIYYELGQAAFLINRSEEGLEYFRKALALNPQPKESHLNLLMGGIFSRRPEIVEQELEEISKRGHSLTANEHVSLANAFAKNCDVERARAQVEAAVKLESNFAGAAKTFISNLEKSCR